jgi:hypothetical protein
MLALTALGAVVSAAVLPITLPSSPLTGAYGGMTYTQATFLFEIGVADGDPISSITTNGKTVTFSTTGVAGSSASINWGIWSTSPQYVIEADPRIVIFSGVTGLDILFQTNPFQVFGFEIEPVSGAQFIQATWFDPGGSIVGGVSGIAAPQSARFLGMYSDGGESFARVHIEVPAAAGGFALAEIRADVPEPGTMALISAGLGGLAFLRRRQV